MAVLTEYFAATQPELDELDVSRGPVRASRALDPPRKVPASKPGFIGRLRREKPTAARVEMPKFEIDSDFDVVPTRGIDPAVNLATLEEILTGDDALAIIKDGGVDVVAHGAIEAEGPWVFTLRSTVLRALASLPQDQIDGVAQQWAATEELVGTPPEVLATLLNDLCGLFKRAEQSGRSVYCWVSL